MPQPMTPAPDARPGWDKIKNLLLGGAQFAAGLAAPGPNTLGAAGIAGIRSMLPGSGSYRQELDRYNLGASPEDSVTDRVPMPGESDLDFMRRESQSPRVQREVMQTSTMAAPIAVHASPNKWSGQPTRSKAGTGEGGAAYGEGLYATVPSNAVGIDRRYRAESSEFKRPVVRLDGFDLDEMAMNPILKERLLAEFPRQVKPGSKIDAEGALMMARVKLEDKIKFADREAARFQALGARDAAGDYLNLASDYRDALDSLLKLGPERFSTADTGSFHVWDVPDRLMDYDAPLAKQSAEVQSAVFDGDMIPTGRESLGWRGAPDAAFQNAKAAESRTGKWLLGELGRGKGETELARRGIQGHTYAGEAGSARTSGIEGDVPNFVIYDDAAVKPLGTFGSADEWFGSDLYKRLKPRIDAEEALRREGKATPEAYARIRALFAEEAAKK